MAKEFPQNHPLLLEGISLFNKGEYFESHEAWEQIWLGMGGSDRNFYKGLILAAACFVHLQKKKTKPALIALGKALGYLKPFQARSIAIVLLAEFVEELEKCKQDLESGYVPKFCPQIRTHI